MSVLSKAARSHMQSQRFLLGKDSLHGVPKLSSHDPNGWAAKGEEINDSNILWRQYVIFVDLYRYYIDLIWKVTIWYYTATGVSLAYFFTNLNANDHGYLPLLLLFLSALSGGMSLIYARAIHYMSEMESWLEYIAVSLCVCQGARMWNSYARSVDSLAERFFSLLYLVLGSSRTFTLSLSRAHRRQKLRHWPFA